jgi:hypothetical protein
MEQAQRGAKNIAKNINILTLPCFTSLFIRLQQNALVT